MDGRIGLLHCLAKYRGLFVVFFALAFVSHLPKLHLVRVWMTIARSQRPHWRAHRAIKVFDLFSRVPGCPSGDPHTNHWFGIYAVAELHKFFQAGTRRLQTAPG